MDNSMLWLRMTQVAWKLPPIIVSLALLLPFALVFWRMTIHKPKSEAERRKALEASLRQVLEQQAPGLDENAPPGLQGISLVGASATDEGELVGAAGWAVRWFGFYPRQWVGWCGLAAVAAIMALATFSAFFPSVPAVTVSTPLPKAGTEPASGDTLKPGSQ